jgi:hypothetical protein
MFGLHWTKYVQLMHYRIISSIRLVKLHIMQHNFGEQLLEML